jgi:hypothetical protein
MAAVCFNWILGEFAKLQKKKTNISFIMSICPHEKLDSHWTNFDETWYLSFFETLSRKLKFH